MKVVRASETDSRVFYQYLVSSIAPRPIALVSTINLNKEVNLSPFSFFNLIGNNPPLLFFAPNNRNKDNSEKDTLQNLKEVPEVVVNLVDEEMVHQVSLASAHYDRGVNEFEKAGFTALPAERVKPPRVSESPVQLECEVREIISIGNTHLVVAEVLLAHVSERILDTKGHIDMLKTRWVGRAGGNWYSKFSKENLFEIPRPVTGIGVDALPLSVRRSAILTGNDLGILGSAPQLPSEEAIKQYYFNEIVVSIRNQTQGVCENFNELLHIRVKELINAGKIEEALLAAFQSH